MAEDIERPKCKCHGEPMARNGSFNGRQQFMCARGRRAHSRENYWSKGRRERMARVYAARKDDGLCTKCGRPGLTETLCWDCSNAQAERDAVRVRV